MRRALAIAILLFSSTAARANDLYGYYDLLIPEAVGELGTRTYDLDVTAPGGDKIFRGNVPVSGGHYLGAGFGLHVLVVNHGFLVGGEASVSGGRLAGENLPFDSTSTALHYSVIANLGYALSLGEVAMIHGAALIGFDGMRFDVAGPQSGIAALVANANPPPSALLDYTLSRHDLRLGLTAGIHVNVAKLVAVWADGSIDYDGQWRVRCGFAFGAPYDVRW
jgi:hypothetical protein